MHGSRRLADRAGDWLHSGKRNPIVMQLAVPAIAQLAPCRGGWALHGWMLTSSTATCD